MVEWRTCTLGEIGEIIGGATPSTKKLENYGGDISWITPKDLADFKGRYIEHGERNITKNGFNSCSVKMLPKNSILFSSRAPIGYLAIAKKEMCTNQGFKSFIPGENIDYLFAYYLLKYNKNKIESMGSGTTFKEVSGKTMKSIEVRIPDDIEYQRMISRVLGSIDDKIELNEKINDNLEKQAQLLFDDFFFNRDALPSKWKRGSLLDIANYLNGLAMQKYRPLENQEGIPVLKIKELRQGMCDGSSELCSSDIKPEYIVSDGDVIFSWSGSLLVDFWCGGKCGLNQHLFKVTSSKYDKWFYYAWTKHHLNNFIALAAAMATTMGHIKRGDLAKSEVLIPSDEDYGYISSILQPMYDFMISNRVENVRLASLREKLLLKLMSNKIDLSEV